jgi:lipopolysaccharide transport system permease protein
MATQHIPTDIPKPTVIEPFTGWKRVSLNLGELWSYRDLIYFMMSRQIKGSYRQMALGPLWIILTPIINIVVYTFVFGQLAGLPSDGVPYPLFVYSAILPWMLFSNSALNSSQSLLQQKSLITKVYFPRLVVPLVSVLDALVNFFVSFLVLLLMMIVLGYYPRPEMLLLPIFLLVGIACGLTVGLWAASWVVNFRDIQGMLGHGLRLGMYLTPVVYAASVVPDSLRLLYNLNPMTGVIQGIRWSLLGVGDPPSALFLLSSAVVFVLLYLGAQYFLHTQRTIVDVI